MRIKKETFLNWFLLVFWMGIIFYFSAQPDLKSGLENQIDFILRKAAHITEYGILTFFSWRVMSDRGVKKGGKYLIAAIVFSILYAVSDEYHQIFISGRVGSPIDVLIDSVGIGIAGIAIWKKNYKFFKLRNDRLSLRGAKRRSNL